MASTSDFEDDEDGPYNPARRVESIEQSLEGRPDKARDAVVTILQRCQARGPDAELTEEEMKFLLDVWLKFRYDFVSERFEVDGVGADYCTLICSALCQAPIETSTATELYDDMAALAKILRIDWLMPRESAAKASFVKLVMNDLSAWKDVLIFDALDDYFGCIARSLQLVAAVERGDEYRSPQQNDVQKWATTGYRGRVFPTQAFVDDVEVGLCGLLYFHSFLRAVVYSGDSPPIAFDGRSSKEAAKAWCAAAYKMVALGQFVDSYFDNFVENAARPGECFAYNKARLHVPNTAREAISGVRPPVFKQAYDSSTKPKVLFEGETMRELADEATHDYARNVAAMVVAIATLQAECGMDMRSKFVSYSQCEALGTKKLDALSYPAIAWTGRLFVVMERQLGGRRLVCSSMLEAIVVIVEWSAESGNPRARKLTERWKSYSKHS